MDVGGRFQISAMRCTDTEVLEIAESSTPIFGVFGGTGDSQLMKSVVFLTNRQPQDAHTWES
jgi:hypothetical protein